MTSFSLSAGSYGVSEALCIIATDLLTHVLVRCWTTDWQYRGYMGINLTPGQVITDSFRSFSKKRREAESGGG